MEENMITELLPEMVDYFLDVKQLPAIAQPVATVGKSIFQKIQSIKEDSFNNKLRIFLTETAKATDKQRIEFLQKLGNDHKKFWSELITQLDNIENEQKVLVTAKLTHALILLYINTEQLSRLNLIIKNIHFNDIEYLKQNFKQTSTDSVDQASFVPFDLDKNSKLIIDNLVNAGLLRVKKGSSVMEVALQSRLGYDLTELGRILTKYGF